MNAKTVIYFKKDGDVWKIKRGKKRFAFLGGISRLFRELSTLILDKDAVVSGHIEILRKKKT